MYRHAIIIHMSYISKRRLALHVLAEDSSVIRRINKNLSDKFQHLRFGFHVIQTQGDSIESIAEKDPFFQDMKYFTDYAQFVSAVECDVKVHYTDVAKVILSENTYTPLGVQKVTFFSYVECFKEYDKPLFEDNFEAWEHGPVIPGLYRDLKSYKNRNISTLDDYEKKILHSRFLQIPDGIETKELIHNISDKHAQLTTTSIYTKGHVKGGPWDLTYNNQDKGPSHEISKKDIKNYAYST